MKYKITVQNEIAVASFYGEILREDKEILLLSNQELEQLNVTLVILNVKNITKIDAGIYRELTLFQHEIRKRNKLKVVGLNLQLKTLLLEKAVIRSNEFHNTLDDALIR